MNDRTVFYSAIPLLDPRNGSSLDDLIVGSGGTEKISRDLADGAHPDVKTFILGGDIDLGDGWNLRTRHAMPTAR